MILKGEDVKLVLLKINNGSIVGNRPMQYDFCIRSNFGEELGFCRLIVNISDKHGKFEFRIKDNKYLLEVLNLIKDFCESTHSLFYILISYSNRLESIKEILSSAGFTVLYKYTEGSTYKFSFREC